MNSKKAFLKSEKTIHSLFLLAQELNNNLIDFAVIIALS